METATAPGSNGLDKLQDQSLPKPKPSKRPWKREQSQSQSGDGSGDDSPMPLLSRGRSTTSRDGTTESDGARSLDMVREEDILGGTAAAGHSDDELFPSRPKPSISSHPSQIGYLTTSSPLVQAEHLQDIRTPDTDNSVNGSSRVSTFHAETTDGHTSTATSSLSSNNTEGLAPPATKARRSVSPAGRFRNVFKSKRSSTASAGSTGSHTPERKRSDTDLADRNSKSSDSLAPSTRAATTTFPPVIVSDVSDVSASSSSFVSARHADGQQPDTSKTTSNERFRRLSRGQKVDTSPRPETPPSNDSATPVIVNTPPTPTDPAHPTAAFGSRTASPRDAAASPAGSANHRPAASLSSTSGSMSSQRRSRAGSASLVPSKLSNFTLAPLTPTPESGSGGSAVTPSASGFFSSVFSAAQNATNSFSNSITSTSLSAPWSSSSKKSGKDQDQDGQSSASDNRQSPEQEGGDEAEVEVESSLAPSFAPSSSSGSKEPAVKTLGMGDLSLSQLGIAEPPKANGASSAANSAANSTSNLASAFAVSPPLHATRASEVASETRHRSESAPADSLHFHPASESFDHGSDGALTPGGGNAGVSVHDGTHGVGANGSFNGGSGGRPASMSDTTDHTPPTASMYGDKPDNLQRTGSIRSAIERRRKRGSSAATGGTIAAAIAAANASFAHPAAHSNMPKLTGFAVASKKRNRDFHNFFKSVPDDDYLIEDYSCALQREILAHGRLYVSEGHLCFSSNILGWVTTLVMSFDEIVSVEKRSTALVFKNGLMISTLHAKHIFASFASRDSTYDLIVKIWKLGHPSLQSSLNGVRIDETGGDKTEKIEAGEDDGASAGSRSVSESDNESDDDSNDVYDEDAEDDDAYDTTQAVEPGSTADADFEKAVTRKASGVTEKTANGTAADKPKDASATSAGGDFPGPSTHAPTDCGDSGTHYEKILADEVIAAPLGKVYSYMFGPASVTFMPKWLSNDQKCTEIQMPDKKGLGPDNKTRTFSYIKPLYGSIGPKQTKCIVTEQIEGCDLEKAVNVVCSTQTPDVPSGNVFVTKTKYCLSWAENNATRVQMNLPIEKGANDGQVQYGKDLFVGLKEALSSRPRSGTATNSAAGKAKRKARKEGKAPPAAGPVSDTERKAKAAAKSDWGVLEPVHGLVGPVVDLVKPLLTGNVMYGLLVGLLVATWFGFGFTNRSAQRGYGRDLGRWAYPDRLAAYDEMWRREESELWDWLEERVGLDRLGDGAPPYRKKVLEPRTVEEKLREERMDDREIKEAIRVTEEKLNVLKQVVDKREKASGE
ncbi:gram domain containing protein [Niveomyces insectorum RCEF 264]|uniref:Gram domain containing protein n=1 Tax=Niveomyces insectorum RCEF 264 TaxID=1081102 RepID=A0A167PUJ8_9HYPO|nr:gram domain containing protein [Niveomyces insectorum RCEF 264]